VALERRVPELIAHAGGHLLESIVQLVVFLGPVPVIFYFLVRALLQPDEQDEVARTRGDRHPPSEEGRDRPATP